MPFSAKILARPEAESASTLERIGVAKRRVQSILDRNTVSHQKTLEQKIAEQGPTGQRVDPHLISLAIVDLLEQNRLRKHTHLATGSTSWYANPATTDAAIQPKLDELATLYFSISGGGFRNLIGDALEVVVFKCLDQFNTDNPRFIYQGHFLLNEPKNDHGRYRKIQPPKSIGKNTTQKEADFLQFGHDIGPLCIECKNYREWLYPDNKIIKELIIKSAELGAIPVLIHRRLHYTTRTNFLEPAGIITHESYYQYFPSDQHQLAQKAKHKKMLGFTDIIATDDPQPRTIKFFNATLPKLVDYMGQRWKQNLPALLEFAHGDINLAQLYTAIGSRAGGKWEEYDQNDETTFDHE